MSSSFSFLFILLCVSSPQTDLLFDFFQKLDIQFDCIYLQRLSSRVQIAIKRKKCATDLLDLLKILSIASVSHIFRNISAQHTNDTIVPKKMRIEHNTHSVRISVNFVEDWENKTPLQLRESVWHSDFMQRRKENRKKGFAVSLVSFYCLNRLIKCIGIYIYLCTYDIV